MEERPAPKHFFGHRKRMGRRFDKLSEIPRVQAIAKHDRPIELMQANKVSRRHSKKASVSEA